MKHLITRDEQAVKVEQEQERPDRKEEVTVVFVFSENEKALIESCIRNLRSRSRHVRIINAAEVIPSKEVEVTPPEEVMEAEAMLQKNPTAFITYSHDTEEWELKGEDPETQRKRVFALAEKLRDGGVNCVIDQHVVNPKGGWPRWTMDSVEESNFVLIVATETYNRRFRGKEDPNKGRGAQWEGAVITQELYDNNGKNDKFVPVVFDRADTENIPLPLKGVTHYNVSNENDYDELYYYLTNQPPYVPKPLGPIRRRPERGK